MQLAVGRAFRAIAREPDALLRRVDRPRDARFPGHPLASCRTLADAGDGARKHALEEASPFHESLRLLSPASTSFTNGLTSPYYSFRGPASPPGHGRRAMNAAAATATILKAEG